MRHAKYSRIDLAYMDVTQPGGTGVCDSQFNRNEEDQGSEENVGQN
jgi:hypothetical protein